MQRNIQEFLLPTNSQRLEPPTSQHSCCSYHRGVGVSPASCYTMDPMYYSFNCKNMERFRCKQTRGLHLCVPDTCSINRTWKQSATTPVLYRKKEGRGSQLYFHITRLISLRLGFRRNFLSSAKNNDICINFMGRTKTKPFLKRTKVPKFYFQFGQQKKCPPFFF